MLKVCLKLNQLGNSIVNLRIIWPKIHSISYAYRDECIDVNSYATSSSCRSCYTKIQETYFTISFFLKIALSSVFIFFPYRFIPSQSNYSCMYSAFRLVKDELELSLHVLQKDEIIFWAPKEFFSSNDHFCPKNTFMNNFLCICFTYIFNSGKVLTSCPPSLVLLLIILLFSLASKR